MTVHSFSPGADDEQAATAHRKSAAQPLCMLSDALSTGPKQRVTRFPRDS